MTDTPKKRNRLLLETLLLVAFCFVLSLVLFFVSVTLTRALIEEYCFNHDVPMDEYDWYHLELTLIGAGFVISAMLFVVLFIVLFFNRIAYIRSITEGVEALRRGDITHRVKLHGNNELTELAQAINYLAMSEQAIRDKEARLADEKENLIRALSHDIRTPLTSIMSYTELMQARQNVTAEEVGAYFDLVGKKTAQIKELTDILLDAGKREVEHFDDAGLLFVQLADEFEEMLEGEFSVVTSMSLPAGMSGSFDVQELQRIFDNLISNVQKYASPQSFVQLDVTLCPQGLVITQKNAVRTAESAEEGYRMGIHSIRRIAQNYGGSVEVTRTEQDFAIVITLPEI